MATIFAIPKTAPQDAATSDLLERLRTDVIPGAVAGTPLQVYVGGNTAGFEDFSDKVAGRLPLFIGVVIGLSVLLLIMAFRSLWVPLVSALFNLLSVGAAYGVVTGVFQEGFGASLLGVDSGIPIVSFIPVMMFAILFGLSMDYNVFLLSRIHEAYNEGDRPRESVIHGMARIGKVILFAGLIMSAVFLAFVTQPDVIAKMFGLGLGLAILIDVLIVRLIIAPAVVMLLGDHAWWLPKWLDKILPNVSLEGHLVENVDPKRGADGRGEAARPLSGSQLRPGRVAGTDEAALVGEHDGLDAAAHVELAQQARDVRLHRRLAEAELVGQRGVGEAAGEPADDVALALGQRDEARAQLGADATLAELLLDQAARDRRGERRVAGGDRAHRLAQPVGGGVLEEEAGRRRPAAPAGRAGRRRGW